MRESGEPVELFLGCMQQMTQMLATHFSVLPKEETPDEHRDETMTVSAPQKPSFPREDFERDEFLLKSKGEQGQIDLSSDSESGHSLMAL